VAAARRVSRSDVPLAQQFRPSADPDS